MSLSSCQDVEQEIPVGIIRERLADTLVSEAYEMLFNDLAYFSSADMFLGFIQTSYREVLYSVGIRVVAGIKDLSSMELEVNREQKTLGINLAAAEILRIDSDERSIQQYFITESGRSITNQDFAIINEEAKARVRTSALERNIIEKAHQSISAQLRHMAQLLGFQLESLEFVDHG